MPKIKLQILENSEVKPLEWIRFINDIASFWDATKDEVEQNQQFVQKANQFHSTIKFTAAYLRHPRNSLRHNYL